MSWKEIKEKYFTFVTPIVWRNLIGMAILHILGIYSLFFVMPYIKLSTWIWGLFIGNAAGIGTTVGAHRLWTHNTYKARLPLRILLICLYLATGQYSLEQWVRDHRTHHKFADTDADPHNAKRGFFFSHCGWLMMKRHPEVKKKGKLIDTSDLKKDPVVQFQQKYFVPLMIFFFAFMPSAVPYFFLGDSLHTSFFALFIFRYLVQLHSTFIVNSVAHLYGTKPYNKNIMAVQNRAVSIFTHGEGWHNFHHVFPWDYRIGEYGQQSQKGAQLIELFAYLGLAYDLKSAPDAMVKRVLAKNGNLDGYREIAVEEIENYSKSSLEEENQRKQENVETFHIKEMEVEKECRKRQ